MWQSKLSGSRGWGCGILAPCSSKNQPCCLLLCQHFLGFSRAAHFDRAVLWLLWSSREWRLCLQSNVLTMACLTQTGDLLWSLYSRYCTKSGEQAHFGREITHGNFSEKIVHVPENLKSLMLLKHCTLWKCLSETLFKLVYLLFEKNGTCHLYHKGTIELIISWK